MRIIDANTVHEVCQWHPLADALLAAHRKAGTRADRAALESTEGDETNYFMAIPAWIPGEAIGAKLTTVFPGNPAKFEGVPAVQAVFALFDGMDGSPLAMIDGTALTYRKTAGDSALGARLLAGPEPKVMTMVGAGGLGPFVIDGFRTVRPSLEKIYIWNRSPVKARMLAQTLRAQDVDAEATPDLEVAIRQSDMISCATNATEPLVKGEWLKAGAHLDLIGAYRDDMRESDDEAVAKARLFVDSRWFAVEKTGELGTPIKNGTITANDVEADLFDMASPDFSFHRNPEDITLFKNGGGAHLDLFAAQFIWNAVNSENLP